MTANYQLVRCRESQDSNDRAHCVATALAHFVRRFVSLPTAASILLPVWVLHTYVFEEFEFTPYLNIISPEPGCGKTTAGDVLAALSSRATSPTCGTAAVLRRMIAAARPTLILDEWDSLDRAVRDTCGNFLNTGFKKGGTYYILEKCHIVGQPTFCPKAIVGRLTIRLAEATLTRSIPFTLHKAAVKDNLEKFREGNRHEADELRQRCQQWADEFRSKQVRVSPNFPDSLDGRQQDICEPLLAIADELGGDWPHGLRDALTTLLASRQRHLQSPENELLRAVQKYVLERNLDEFLSLDFCNWANAQEETPWSAKPLTPAKLAEMLRIYDLHPGQINRIVNGKQKNCRGYAVAAFQHVFNRYLNTTPASAV